MRKYSGIKCFFTHFAFTYIIFTYIAFTFMLLCSSLQQFNMISMKWYYHRNLLKEKRINKHSLILIIMLKRMFLAILTYYSILLKHIEWKISYFSAWNAGDFCHLHFPAFLVNVFYFFIKQM